MRKIFSIFASIFALLDQRGMASFNDVNLGKSADLYPPQKTDPTEVNSRIKSIRLKYNMNAVIAVNDEILGSLIPENALIHDALVKISGSTGAGGIFDFGLKAGSVIDSDSSNEDSLEAFAEDQDALILAADAGGQAVFKRAGLGSLFLNGMNKRVGKGGLQPFLKCTEATTTTVATPREIEAIVYYSLES